MGAIAEREGRKRAYPVKAGAVISGNTPVALDGGYLVSIGAGICAGVARFLIDNSAGGDGSQRAEVVTGEHKFVNSGDITLASVGAKAWFVDASSLSSANGDGAHTEAGVITQVDPDGVWVALGI